MNRRIISSKSSSSPPKREETCYYRYLKPGALAQIRDSRILRANNLLRGVSASKLAQIAAASVTSTTVTNVQNSSIAANEGAMLFCNRWKKNISQEASVWVKMMNNADTYMEEGRASVLHGRSNKPKTKMVCRRLARALRFLLAIPVVNLPLYMMFLAKDWID